MPNGAPGGALWDPRREGGPGIPGGPQGLGPPWGTQEGPQGRWASRLAPRA